MNNLAENRPEQQTHRFFLPDLQEVGIWLTARLKAKYPNMADPTIVSWLRSLMQSDEYLFIRRGQAVMLAQMVKDGVDSAVTVRTIFVVCKEDTKDFHEDGAYLFDDLYRWSSSLGAKEIVIGETNDVPVNLVEEVLGSKLQKRSVLVWRPQR